MSFRYFGRMSNLDLGSETALPESSAAVPFEQAMKKLETIVESMEADEMPLEQLLSSYEQGMHLVQACQRKLAEAELKIQQLEKNAAGETILKPAALAADSADV